MSFELNHDRRALLAVGAGALLALPATAEPLGASPAEDGNRIDPDRGVTAPEDLMREHGVLNRCLLIYEEAIRRIRGSEEIGPEVFHHTAALIRKFVEDYHEKNEEKYFFTLFKNGRNAGKPAKLLRHARGVDFSRLVSTLQAQHDSGRRLTTTILTLSQSDPFRSAENRTQIVSAAEKFIRMYRPHENWEDTVLYPAIRTVLTPKEVDRLGERMEEDEHKILGDEGYERAVVEVASIEKALGLYDLAQFTAM